MAGAQQLSQTQRESFANDPLNLVAVGSQVNSAKGDGDAATWLPPLKSYRCTDLTSQILIKAKYALWIAPAEHDAMARVLSACPGQSPLPGAPSPTPTPPVPALPAPAPARAPVTVVPGGYGSTPGSTGVARTVRPTPAARKVPTHPAASTGIRDRTTGIVGWRRPGAPQPMIGGRGAARPTRCPPPDRGDLDKPVYPGPCVR